MPGSRAKRKGAQEGAGGSASNRQSSRGRSGSSGAPSQERQSGSGRPPLGPPRRSSRTVSGAAAASLGELSRMGSQQGKEAAPPRAAAAVGPSSSPGAAASAGLRKMGGRLSAAGGSYSGLVNSSPSKRVVAQPSLPGFSMSQERGGSPGEAGTTGSGGVPPGGDSSGQLNTDTTGRRRNPHQATGGGRRCRSGRTSC